MRGFFLSLLFAAVSLGITTQAQPTTKQLTPQTIKLSQAGSDSLFSLSNLIKRHGDDEHHSMSPSQSHAADSNSSVTQSHKHSSGHDHNSHTPTQLLINETLILLTHSPDPPAYYQLQRGEAHHSLLIAHIALSTIAFFAQLPLTIALKGAKSNFAVLSQASFVVTALLGLLFGWLYSLSTPALYEHNKHRSFGWFAAVLVIALAVIDGARYLRPTSWLATIQSPKPAAQSELYSPLLAEEESHFALSSPTEMDDQTHSTDWNRLASTSQVRQQSPPAAARQSSTSCHSDETMFEHVHLDDASPPAASHEQLTRTARIVRLLPTILEWTLLFLAYSLVISGIAVYYGACRENYLNGCMAHAIKGSVFLWFGVLTWARFLGAFAAFGWAWNKRPSQTKGGYSMEFWESALICFYGATNVWLERLGKGGSPWSVKDVQHASIAGMFWAAGAVGMLLESRTVRGWLAQSAVRASGKAEHEISQPASASFSFNPFPALVIGVTGVAMSVHHQTFAFQVEIHALWGLLLGLAAAFRILTYAFLYLRPPASILPGRPPTEALASLCLTAGGLVFILSTEQVTFAAMRMGFDDMMAFLNVTVTMVCVWFVELLLLRAVQGWALARGTRHPVDQARPRKEIA